MLIAVCLLQLATWIGFGLGYLIGKGLWRALKPPRRKVMGMPDIASVNLGRLSPDLITLDEERGIRFDMTGYDREKVARTAYRLGKDGGWKP